MNPTHHAVTHVLRNLTQDQINGDPAELATAVLDGLGSFGWNVEPKSVTHMNAIIGHPAAQVAQFHSTFGHPVEVGYDANMHVARANWLEEELTELRDAIAAGDVYEVIDAYNDLAYFAFGGLVTILGYFAAALTFDHTHDSNMSKADADGNPVVLPDGKIGKSPLYWKPDYKSVVGDVHIIHSLPSNAS